MLISINPEAPEPMMDDAIRVSMTTPTTTATPHRIKLPSLEEQQPVKRNLASRKLGATPRQGARRRKPVAPQGSNHKLTEYFPVRRSVRRTKRAVLEQRQRDLEMKLLCGVEEGLEVGVTVQ